MNEILNMPINDMPDLEFDCSCGRRHHFNVHGISIRKGAIEDLPEMAEPFKDGKVLVVSDSNTYKVAGLKTAQILKDNGFNIKEVVFECGDGILIPNEETIGRIVLEQDLDVVLMVAVGSGVINDSVKYVTSRCDLPYIIVGTAPSMDGYVADGAPIILQGYKYSPQAHLTYGLIGDTDFLKTAPMDLIEAGFGDVVGKITALTDWDLAVKIKGEYRCDTACSLTRSAMDKCFAKAELLKERDPGALAALMEALTMTGVAMALVEASRPASGAEHMLSHYWEMDYISRGLDPIHHGLQVGAATPVIARFFEELRDILPDGTGELCPPHEEIEELLKKGGAPSCPKEIGISRDLFLNSLLEGYTVRPRYSVMLYAKENGRLEDIARKITSELYD